MEFASLIFTDIVAVLVVTGMVYENKADSMKDASGNGYIQIYKASIFYGFAVVSAWISFVCSVGQTEIDPVLFGLRLAIFVFTAFVLDDVATKRDEWPKLRS